MFPSHSDKVRVPSDHFHLEISESVVNDFRLVDDGFDSADFVKYHLTLRCSNTHTNE